MAKKSTIAHLGLIHSFLFIFAFLHATGVNSATNAQSLPLSLRKDVRLSPRNRKDFDIWIARYKQAICFEPTPACSVDGDGAIRARDALIYAAISQIDINFTNHERSKRHRKEVFETLMDFLKLGADTAAVISNGARSKTVITAASGLVQLLRESTEKTFRLKEAEIIFNRMEADRARVLGVILTNIRGDTRTSPPIRRKDLDDYPFEAAWIDIVAYYRAGTVDSALAGLSADTGTAKKNAQENVDALKRSRP
jgi:hypothetical protein